MKVVSLMKLVLCQERSRINECSYWRPAPKIPRPIGMTRAGRNMFHSRYSGCQIPRAVSADVPRAYRLPGFTMAKSSRDVERKFIA